MKEARKRTTVADSSDAAQAERCLADLVEEITLRIERGEAFDVEEYRRAHPQLAAQIGRLAPTLEVLDDLRNSGAALQGGADPAVPASAGTAGGGPSGAGGGGRGRSEARAGAAPGHLLGDYRIIREVGRGGMGVVYEAEQMSLGRRVALKVLPFAAVLDPKQVQRFKNEAHAAAQLHHSNIVPVYSVGCERGVHFYAMQYVEGHPLDEVIHELRGLDGAAAGAPAEAGASRRSDEASASRAAWLLASGLRDASSATGDPAAPCLGESGTAPLEPSPPVPPEPPRAARGPVPSGSGSASRSISSLTPASTRSSSFFRSVADLGVQAAEALQHAHDLGVVHRDIKPSNLILDFNGNLWVTDFGLAQYQQGTNLTMSGDILGTLRYMSPEQALAKRVNVDHRTDVYSLGATLYELLTQRPAFGGKDREELLRQIVFEEARPPRRWIRSIPVDLETVVLKAIEKDPSGRYASARELAEDLRRFLEDRPIQARRPGPAQHASKWVRRHKAISAAAAAVLAALLVSGIVVERVRRSARLIEYETVLRDAVGRLEAYRLTPTALRGEALGLGLASEIVMPGEHTSLRAQGPSASLRAVLSDLEDAARLLPRRPDAYYHQARALLAEEDIEAAAARVQRALACDPGFVPARALEAHILKRRGKAAEAAEVLDRASSSGGQEWARDWLAAQEALDARDWKAAADGYGRLCRLVRRREEPYLGLSLEAFLGRGVALFELGEYGRAVEDFVTARALWGDSLQPGLLLVTAYIAQNRTAEAESIAEELWADDRFAPEEVAIWLATTFAFGHQRDAAERWMDRIADELMRTRVRAFSYEFLCREEDMLEVVAPVLETRPDDLQLRARMVDALAPLGRFPEALEHAQAMRRIAPESVHTMNAFAYIDYFRGRLDDAERASREAVATGQDRARAPITLASALWRKGQVEEAERIFDRLFREVPRYWVSLMNWGCLLRMEGRAEEAVEKLEAARESGSDEPETLGNLAIALEDDRRPEEARRVYEVLLRLHPSQGWASFRLGRIYEDVARDLEAAAEQYLESIAGGRDEIEAHERLSRLVRREAAGANDPSLAAVLGAGLDRLGGLLDSRRERDARLLATVAIARAVLPARQDPPKALELARRAVECAKRDEAPRCLEVLAEVHLAAGRGAEAVETLERALGLPEATRTTKARLDETRRRIAPLLPTCGSIDAALEERDREVLLGEDATWRCFGGREEPPDAWRDPGFDDSSWESGPSGSWRADRYDGAAGVDGARAEPAWLCLRRAVEVEDPSRYDGYALAARSSGGLVAWLNGEEIGRLRLGAPGSPVPADAAADLSGEPEEVEFLVPGGLVRKGPNVLAIRGVDASVTGSGSSLVPVFRGLLPVAPGRAAALRDRVRASEQGSGRLGAYLEGRLLEREGRLPEAAGEYASAAAADPAADEPLLRLAAALRAAGDPQESERRLGEAIAERDRASRAVWEAWIETGFVGLRRSAREMLEIFPRPAVKAVEPGPGTDDPSDDVRWILERLAAGDGVRIHWGTDDYTDRAGGVWSRDRFALAGKADGPIVMDIHDTEDDALYQGRRIFPDGAHHPAGYRIPLEPGRYRVTLHFAEVFFGDRIPGRAVQDIGLEGKTIVSAHDLSAAGFRTADRKTFEAVVADGFLDLELRARRGWPRISAIEIERIE